jgi:Ca-activated chloride channel family protein
MRNDGMRRVGWICGLAGALAVLGWGAACSKSDAPATQEEAQPVAASLREAEQVADGEKGRAGSAEGLRGAPAPMGAPAPVAVPGGASRPAERRDGPGGQGLVGDAKPKGAFGSPSFANDSAPVLPVKAAAIDPNGRFATTYRPGGGHLASFEAALSQGIVTSNERDIVSDIGARYAPSMEPPKDKALALRVDVERAKLAPNGGEVHVRVALRSSTKAPPRPQLSVHLVLDVSGSMRGEPIARARDAALALVERLDDKDDFSLVTFSSDANVLIPGGPIGARRAAIKKTIEGIEGGGRHQHRRGASRWATSRPSSKGASPRTRCASCCCSPTAAPTRASSSPRRPRPSWPSTPSRTGIQTSSFGIGSDYDGPLMSAIARRRRGGLLLPARQRADQPRRSRAELDQTPRSRWPPPSRCGSACKPDDRAPQDLRLSKRLSARPRRSRGPHPSRSRRTSRPQKRDSRSREIGRRTQEGGMRFFIPAFARDDSPRGAGQAAAPRRNVGNRTGRVSSR